MRVSEISSFLESLYPPSLQEDYDNCGLITGSPEQEVTGVLLTLDITPEVFAEAKSSGCNMIVSHHPMVFRGLKKITGGDPVQDNVIMAIREGIAVFALHTSLDNALEGLNKFLAGKFGLKKVRILQPRSAFLQKLVTYCPEDHAGEVREALFGAGAGHIGNYDQCSYNIAGEGTFRANELADPFVGEKNKLHVEKEIRIEVVMPGYLRETIISALFAVHPYEEVAYDVYSLANEFSAAGSGIIGDLEDPVSEKDFLSRIKEVTGIPVVRHSRLLGKDISKVAICTGSGAFLLSRARTSRADIFLTGDLKYHDFFEAGEKMLIADIGHYESEYHVKELLFEVLTKKFANFAILVSKTVTNPVNYF